jgi:hypothetical protein
MSAQITARVDSLVKSLSEQIQMLERSNQERESKILKLEAQLNAARAEKENTFKRLEHKCGELEKAQATAKLWKKYYYKQRIEFDKVLIEPIHRTMRLKVAESMVAEQMNSIRQRDKAREITLYKIWEALDNACFLATKTDKSYFKLIKTTLENANNALLSLCKS